MQYLKLYNTLIRKKVTFRSMVPKTVKMYTCGPTVYNHAHIGNFRAYITADLLKRTLIHNSYNVKQVMNITDVGQLVGDGNLGEDKLKLTARLEHKLPKQVAEYYERIFFKDMDSLNITQPDIIARATDHIPQMLNLIYSLDKKGFIYKIATGMYFNTIKFSEYGKLFGTTFKKLNRSLIAGSRVERPEGTLNITDFAVWRFSKPKEKSMVWDSKYGKGFPGWHIECSAISMKYLGNQFDIHTGGVDHIQIHHQNEITQSESYTGKKFVNYWVHTEFLKVNGKKMSKSLHNTYTLDDIKEKGFNQFDYKYLILSGHYRKIMNFTFTALENAMKTLKILYQTITKLSSINSSNGTDTEKEFVNFMSNETRLFFESINNDLNTPEALTHLHAIIKSINSRYEQTGISKTESDKALKYLMDIDTILGLKFEEYKKVYKPPKEVKALISKREKARKEKRFKDADMIRTELNERFGIIIEDTNHGTKWKVK